MQDFENKMKLAQTNLITKTAVAGIATAMILGLSGCGNAERHNARQNFKEKVAAIKVCAQDSTYSEFRQAAMDLRTSYEVNKANLEDVRDGFVSLDKLMTACDYFWSYSINHPATNFRLTDENRANYLLIMDVPPTDEVDTWPMHYVQKGLTKISDQTDGIMNLLEK
jgi:hypothetical protein